MGWNIGVKENTLKMSQEVADKLKEVAEENYHVIGYYDDTGLEFDSDAMEHMDFLCEEWALEILDDPSVNGDVVFMSAEGDNKGKIWGYRFKEGKMFKLTAKLWMEEEDERMRLWRTNPSLEID